MKNKILNLVLLCTLAISVIANQVFLAGLEKTMGVNQGILSSISSIKLFSDTKLTGNLSDDATKLSYVQGVPDKYGGELNVSFDQVENSMNIMKAFDPSYGNNKINLSSDQKQRYITIGLKIACEFCCGTTGLVLANGDASCGCAHSQAMRGLEAYLITKHGSDYTDDQILRELARWKGHYFPKQMVQKTMDQITSGKYTPDVAALLLDVKLHKYGANDTKQPTQSDLQKAPDMVGGC